MAKGIIPDDHSCYAGVLFHSCSEIVADVYRQADLVIGVGYDPIEFNYEAWMPYVPLVHMDTMPADISPDYEVVCDIVGDLATSVAYLHSLQLPVYNWDLEMIKENTNKIFQALQPETHTFTPARMLNILREVLPEDGIITGDVGAHLHLVGQLWKVNEPNRFLITNGWSAMGFGLPAAIGAKLCEPDKPVVCITGDGGFLMNCGELITARRLGINIVVIVLCDGDMSLIKVKQGWKDVAKYKTDLYQGEYFGAEQFLGAPVFRASDESDMKAALQKVFSVFGPVIIEALVDGSEYNNLITRRFK
jgi:acetolactate synthase-1/2/3 large subunit